LTDNHSKGKPIFYGWIVIAISFISLFAIFGVRSAFGAFVGSWEAEFAAGRSQIALISMLGYVTFALFQPLMGKMNDHLGARTVLTLGILLTGAGLMLSSLASELWHLVLFYSLIASIGMSASSNVTATAVVTRWFEQKQGTVLGIVLAGMSVGQLILGPASIFLIENYDWRFALNAFGVGILLLAPLSIIFMRSRPEDIGLQPFGTGKSNPGSGPSAASAPAVPAPAKAVSFLRSRTFWYLTLAQFACGFTDAGLISTHFIPYAEGRNFSVALIAAAFGTIAAFNILGTVGTGYLSDRLDRGKILATIYWSRAIVFILLLTLFDNPTGLVLFAIIYGLAERAAAAPTSSLCAHHFKDMSIGLILGYVSISHNIGSTAGSYIPGLLFDLTGSYVSSFIISIVMLFASGLIVLKIADSRSG